MAGGPTAQSLTPALGPTAEATGEAKGVGDCPHCIAHCWPSCIVTRWVLIVRSLERHFERQKGSSLPDVRIDTRGCKGV